MEREEERVRRRLRDRERRRSMTNEEREQHLARRRRNYQLRRQRAAAANVQSTAIVEATPHLQCLIPSTSLDHTLFQSSQFLQGSSNHVEDFPRTLRLSIIKRFARKLASPMSVTSGSISKPLRLNSVKRLARSLRFHSENTTIQNS